MNKWVSERASEWGSEWMNGYIPKVLWPWQFFEHVQVEIELSLRATVWCTFCRSLSPIEPRNRRNRDPTSATKDGHFTQKKHRVSRTWIHAFPTCYTSQLRDDDNDDDDVVGMMMWLTSWWHDDDVVDMMVRMLPLTIVRNSEVFEPNFLW